MTKRKRGLGRGLGALIPTSAPDMDTTESDNGLRTVPIERIQPNPHQPRIEFDKTALAELTDSIREHGLIQPLIVQQSDSGDYTLIAGERRLRACRLAGIYEVPVVVKEATPQAMLELAIIENVQRADLNILEEGEAYRQLMESFGLTQAEVAKRMGKSRPAVANAIRVLALPENVRSALINGVISGGHARALLGLDTEAQQTSVLNSIIQNEWSVRRTEDVIRKLKAQKAPVKKKKKEVSAELSHLQTRFQEQLGTKVNIEQGRNGGRVVIHYYSDEELHAIYTHILGEE